MNSTDAPFASTNRSRSLVTSAAVSAGAADAVATATGLRAARLAGNLFWLPLCIRDVTCRAASLLLAPITAHAMHGPFLCFVARRQPGRATPVLSRNAENAAKANRATDAATSHAAIVVMSLTMPNLDAAAIAAEYAR